MGRKKHFINLIFTLTLLGVFALAAVLVAVMGAQVYQHSANNMQANFDTRTSLVYMSEKIRQCPQDGISVGKIEGGDALILAEEYDGEKYESWIYVHKGALHEVLVPAGSPVNSGDGQNIMDINKLEISDDGTLLTITVENPDGEKDSLSLSRRV
jgi:hypothetical protein